MANQRGVVYLWMLFLVFILGLGLGKGLDVYSTTSARAKEKELLLVGTEYREAIKQYYLSSPNGIRRYPDRLTDLLRDPRFPVTKRYLRRIYLDPVTSKPFEPLISPEGGIWGVRSGSVLKPFKVSGFREEFQHFERARSYQEWYFVYP